jgi:hypothetical protein
MIHPLAPVTGNASELAESANSVVSRSHLPSGLSSELLVAELATIAWHESRLNTFAVGSATPDKLGDIGAYGAYQIEHNPVILGNAEAQTRLAVDRILSGYRICPKYPLAPFAGGCSRRGAVLIANDRLKEAETALMVVHIMHQVRE